jgi:hypothetical protein
MPKSCNAKIKPIEDVVRVSEHERGHLCVRVSSCVKRGVGLVAGVLGRG